MQELNIPILKDSMGGDDAGAFWYTLSLDSTNETRSTSQNFYTPSRPNLHLLTNNQVGKVIFQSQGLNVSATGVEFSRGEGEEIGQVSAMKEVILAAGALHTPQILQLSGIGDTSHLSSLGIETVVNLPGVGANYQDHPLLITGQSSKFLLLSSSGFY
jgi:choline dehydrogenase-like flavoprotein